MNKKLLTLGLIVGLSLSLVGCAKESSEESSQNSQGQTEETQDYTATTEVKTAVLEYGNCYHATYTGDYGENGKLCCFYMAYNRKYYMSLQNGGIRIWAIERINGGWSIPNYSGINECGIIDVGVKNTITDIVEKPERSFNGSGGGMQYPDVWANFQPKHGYSVTYTTENKDTLYMRILATDYTLNEYESLKTVTIKYQLF